MDNDYMSPTSNEPDVDNEKETSGKNDKGQEGNRALIEGGSLCYFTEADGIYRGLRKVCGKANKYAGRARGISSTEVFPNCDNVSWCFDKHEELQ